MESEFQNYVSEFDLNLFEQATKNNRVDTSSTQCPVSRKLGIARIKERLKGVSQVVHKAKNTNEILLKVQEELRFSKQELEETRNLLFEKNEEHKVICEERSMYFTQASEYCNEIQILKEKVKNIEELEFGTQLKDKIINGYSEQMKGLQIELDNLKESKKGSEKDAARVMRRANINKTVLEKQLKRLLTQYVLPNTKERCRWLQSIIRQYITKESKEDDEKIEKQDEVVEKDDEISSDVEVPLSQPVLQHYTSTDFDCVESIDTGRGSSLAYSDGDKSFHSPDYYMGDSPPCVNPPCNKCNVTKSDASTSPISQETLAVTHDFALKMVMVSKKDSCTSPIPLLTRDITTDTADMSLDDTPINKNDNTNLENNHLNTREITHLTNNNEIVFGNKEFSSHPTVIQSDSQSEQKTVKTPIKLQDFTFDSGDEDDEIISGDSRVASSVGVLNAMNSADFDKIVIHSKFNVSREESPAEKEHENISEITHFTNIEEISLENKVVSSRPTVTQSDIQSEQKTINKTPIKLQDFTFNSGDENDEMMSGDSRVASPVGVPNALNSADFDKVVIHSKSNVFMEEPPAEKKHVSTSEITRLTNIEEISLKNKEVSSRPTVIPEKETNKIESSIFDSEDEGGELVSGDSCTVNPVSDTLSDFNVKVVTCNNKNISSEKKPAVKIQSNKELYAEETRETSCTVKLQVEAASETDDDELMHYANKIENPDDECSTISSLCFGENRRLSLSLPSNELLTNPTEIYNVTTDLETNISRCTQHEKQNLELKSSNSCSTEYDMNSEVRAILDEMRSYRPISPIPASPPLGEILSPRPPENYEINYDKEAQTHVIAESLNSQLNLLSTKLQGVFAPFIETIPKCIDQVLSLLDEPHKRTISSLLGSTVNIKEKKCNLLPANDNLKLNYNRQPETAGLNLYSKEHNLLPPQNHLKPIYNGQPEKAVPNLYSRLSTTEVNQNQVHEFVSIDEDSAAEDLEILTVVESSSVHSDGVCKSNELSSVAQKSGPSFKAEISKLVSGIVPSSDRSNECCNSNYDHGASRSTHALFGSDSEFIEDTESRGLLSNAVATPIVFHFKDNILYEGDDMCNNSDNNIMQLDDPTQHKNENSVEVLEKRKSKVKKLTKLERMRLKMVPKCKIKRDLEKSIKKPVLKPNLVTSTLTKNKVSISDTAATLNDKSVYENAVKILAAQRLLKEPRIVIEKSVFLPQNKSIGNEKHCKNNNSPEWSSNNSKTNKKRNSSENVTNSPGSRSLDPYPLSNLKDKRTSICLDESHKAPVEMKQKPYKSSPKSDENIYPKVEKKANKITRKTNPSCDKSDSETSRTKRSLEPALSPGVSSAKESKRKRISVSDRQSLNRNFNCNSTVVESYSSRILRSYSQAKHTKEKESEEYHVVAKRREGLRSSADQRPLGVEIQESCPSLVKKQRISRVNTHTQQDSESMQVLSHSFSASKPSQKNNDYSSVNLDFISNDNHIQDSPMTSRNERHDRISEVNTHTQRDDKSTQPQFVNHHSAVPKLCQKNNDRVISYEDLDILSNDIDMLESKQTEYRPEGSGRKDSLLCQMIDKYGVRKIKLKARQAPESKLQEVCNELETRLSEIIELPHELTLSGMKRLAADIRTWNVKHFLLGFIKFLRNAERKIELFNKSSCPPAPSMTKKEQVLIFIFDELQKSPKYRHIVRKILAIIEYTLFALNKPAEEFNVIEVMSHFYAILCRTYNNISRLRIFIIDAMYCLQFKSVVLVQQCLDVWMFVLPLGHMGLAKCPLVACLVYLLHFYKCEDRYNRVQDIRNTLRWKYNYDLQEWNEPKILELFRTAITEIKDIPMERKILRLALLILAKRNGASWCNNNVVINMLLPIINGSKTSVLAKQFSISMLGPLLKPYPANMKVHSETIIDYLMDMLQKKNSQKLQEVIISSLICLDKNNYRLYRYLANWTPRHVSLEFELLIKNYVTSKPLHTWKNILSRQI